MFDRWRTGQHLSAQTRFLVVAASRTKINSLPEKKECLISYLPAHTFGDRQPKTAVASSLLPGRSLVPQITSATPQLVKQPTKLQQSNPTRQIIFAENNMNARTEIDGKRYTFSSNKIE